MRINDGRRGPHSRLLMPTGAALGLWAVMAPPLAAGGPLTVGDGSGSNNPHLLGGVPAECDCVLATPPHEWDAPPFGLDWSLALRGAYVRGADGEHFETMVVPNATMLRRTMRGGYELTATAEIAGSGFDSYRLDALEASVSGDYRVEASTGLSGRLDLSLTQDSPDPPDDPGGTASAPVVVSGEAEAAVTRELGPFVATLRGSVGRTVYGTTTLNDGTVDDNSTQNSSTAAVGLRVGYALTPVLTAFVEGSAGYQLYDLPSPTYLAKLDAADYALRTGLSARWLGVLEAEVSAGIGLRRFAEPSFPDVVSALYDASLTWRPDEATTLEASLATIFGSPGPDSGGTVRVEYVAGADARYQVNPWFALRGSAAWSYATLAGTADAEITYDAGAGIDYAFSEVTMLTADYAYGWTADTGGTGDAEHRVTLGMVLTQPRSGHSLE